MVLDQLGEAYNVSTVVPGPASDPLTNASSAIDLASDSVENANSSSIGLDFGLTVAASPIDLAVIAHRGSKHMDSKLAEVESPIGLGLEGLELVERTDFRSSVMRMGVHQRQFQRF